MRCSSRSYLPLFIYSFVPSHLTGAMVDLTAYADEAHTPKIALRQIFGRLGLRSELCRAAADGGLLSVEVFAMLGDTATAVKTSLQTLLPTATLGVDAAAQELSLMQLAAVWHSCFALQGQFASRRARMEEDPNKIPEMAQEDHAEFRSRFVTAHPDVILLDAKEPHKKFVEKLSRDFLVHGMVPFYTVAEIRTRADSIVQKSGLTKNAEDLLTISKAEEPEQVTDVQTLLHRVHAYFMALEYLNICTYSRKAGPLRYLQELEQFRTECPGLPYLLSADSLIRKKVNRLQAEQRELYGTYEQALLEVLDNHKYLWNDARTKAVLAKVDRTKPERTDPQDQEWSRMCRRVSHPPSANASATRIRPTRSMALRSSRLAESKLTRRKTLRSTRTKGSLRPNGTRSHKRPPRSRAQSAATTSTLLWAAHWETNAGSSICAWSAALLTLWWAITEKKSSSLPSPRRSERMKSHLL